MLLSSFTVEVFAYSTTTAEKPGYRISRREYRSVHELYHLEGAFSNETNKIHMNERSGVCIKRSRD